MADELLRKTRSPRRDMPARAFAQPVAGNPPPPGSCPVRHDARAGFTRHLTRLP